MFPVSDSEFAHSLLQLGRTRQKPSEKAIEDVEFETDVLQETAIIIPTAKNNKFILENGKKKFLVSLSPMKCICFYYSWYGKKCKHVNLVERTKFPKDPPEVLEHQVRIKGV